MSERSQNKPRGVEVEGEEETRIEVEDGTEEGS